MTDTASAAPFVWTPAGGDDSVALRITPRGTGCVQFVVRHTVSSAGGVSLLWTPAPAPAPAAVAIGRMTAAARGDAARFGLMGCAAYVGAGDEGEG